MQRAWGLSEEAPVEEATSLSIVSLTVQRASPPPCGEGQGWGAAQVTHRQRDFPAAQQRAKRMRRQPTPAENRLWKLLRKIDGHFRRQPPIGPYVFDVVEMTRKLVIEVDGGIHDQGFRVLRIPNVHVFGTGEPAVIAAVLALRRS
jgi:very-short-patch-repair endonuclease